MTRNNSTMTHALMLVGGGVAGVGLALLLAPHSGRENRRKVVHFGKSLQGKGEKAVNGLADTIVNFVDRVEEKAGGTLHNGKGLTRRGKRNLLNAIAKGQETLAHQKRQVERMMG